MRRAWQKEGRRYCGGKYCFSLGNTCRSCYSFLILPLSQKRHGSFTIANVLKKLKYAS